MAINFDELPNQKPNNVVPKGRYKAIVDSAEMKKSNSGNNNLNLTSTLVDLTTGKSVGKLFDLLSEPTHDITKFKLKRFIEALKIPITGSFELKDLAKVVTKGKEYLVDVTIQSDESGKYPDKNVVDVFTGEIYYPIEKKAAAQSNTMKDLDGNSIAQDEIDEINAIDSGADSDSAETEY